MGMNDDLVNIFDLSRMVGLSDRTIRRLVRGGSFPKPLHLGAARRWRRKAVEKWITDCETSSPTTITYNTGGGTGSALLLEARHKVKLDDEHRRALFQTPDGIWHMVHWLTTTHYSLWDFAVLVLCEDESIPEITLPEALALLSTGARH
jgi:prophage regulatory protein